MSAEAVVDTEHIWRELHDSLRQFVGRRVRRPADVDDIVQRIFLQVHRSLPTLRDSNRLHAWLYQTARRAIVDHYRMPAATREVAVGMALDVPEGRAPEDDGDEVTALQELASCVPPLVASLGELDREALRLVEVEGLTQAEAARRLGLSVSGMKSRVQRAHARLRDVVDACCRIELDRRGGLLAYEPRHGQCGGECGPASESEHLAHSRPTRPKD